MIFVLAPKIYLFLRGFSSRMGECRGEFFAKLPITVTGSYRTYTGFSINPCGTYNDWFKTNKCYLFFA